MQENIFPKTAWVAFLSKVFMFDSMETGGIKHFRQINMFMPLQ